jgi:hypothetical protein
MRSTVDRRPIPRFQFLLIAVVALGFAAHSLAATITFRINATDRPPAYDWQAPGGPPCLYPSADGGAIHYTFAQPITLRDPLPVGSVVTQVSVRIAFMLTPAFNMDRTATDRGSLYIALNLEFIEQSDRYIGSALPSVAEPRSFCESPPFIGSEWRDISGPVVPTGLPYYRYGMSNEIGVGEFIPATLLPT